MNKLIQILILTFTRLQFSLCVDCSSQKVSIMMNLASDVMNNNYSQVNASSYLWHVAILKQEQSGLGFLCGGTIIHANFVLTAASCVSQVLPSSLKVVPGLSLIHSPLEIVESTLPMYNVSEKYYPYHPNGVTQEEDLAVLKLKENVTHITPQLVALSPTERMSKNCFTLGWGVYHHHTEKNEGRSCPRPNIGNSLAVAFDHSEKNIYMNNLVNIRNLFGLSSMFIFKVFNIFSVETQEDLPDLYCPKDEFAHLKMVKVSAKAKRHWSFCTENRHLCVSGWNNTNNLPEQVDIGSPILCKIKKPKFVKSYQNELPTLSQYGLVGIITSKTTEQVILNSNISISIMRADNITHFAHFIFHVLKHNV